MQNAYARRMIYCIDLTNACMSALPQHIYWPAAHLLQLADFLLESLHLSPAVQRRLFLLPPTSASHDLSHTLVPDPTHK